MPGFPRLLGNWIQVFTLARQAVGRLSHFFIFRSYSSKTQISYWANAPPLIIQGSNQMPEECPQVLHGQARVPLATPVRNPEHGSHLLHTSSPPLSLFLLCSHSFLPHVPSLALLRKRNCLELCLHSPLQLAAPHTWKSNFPLPSFPWLKTADPLLFLFIHEGLAVVGDVWCIPYLVIPSLAFMTSLFCDFFFLSERGG